MNKYLTKSDEFSIKSEDNVCFIDFSAPSSKNAVSLLIAFMMKDIISLNTVTGKTVFEDFLKEEKIALIVMRSLVDNIFSSGGHLHDLYDAEKNEHAVYTDSVKSFCKLLGSLSTPSITILAGNCYGGGAELALATDFRWSIGKKVELHFVQAKLGVPGGWGGMTRLSELCPALTTKKVSSMFLAQEVLSFQELCYLSLIDKSFEDEKTCYSHLFKWRDNILSCSEKLKEDFSKRCKVSLDKLEEYDASFFNKYFLSDSHKKNIDNFINRGRLKIGIK